MKTPRVYDFDPSVKIPQLGSPMDHLPSIQKPNTTHEQTQPLPQRPNVRRIITRNSFEIYEDQMDDLRREAYEEKLVGGTGSMRKMVRDAIDTYLEKGERGSDANG